MPHELHEHQLPNLAIEMNVVAFPLLTQRDIEVADITEPFILFHARQDPLQLSPF